MRASLRPLLWTAAVATTLALPSAVRAQQPRDPIQVLARSNEADRLDSLAVVLEESNSRRLWGKAAALREKAAGMRAPSDPLAFKGLETAALVRHALEQRPAALALMERAADRALARGDVFNAASAYANVAFMASELRDIDRVRLYAEKSALLATSPLLSAPERAWLQERVAQGASGTRAFAVAPKLP
ncbi:MAG: hypothetical protein ACXW0Z_20420 [Gemmatirosa sp.]